MNDQTASAPPPTEALPFLPLIAATPVIFAILTIPYLNSVLPFVDFLRFFAIPVTIIELIVVLLAVMRGVDILAPLRGEKLWVKLALATLCAVAIGTALFVESAKFSANVRTFAWGVHLLFGLSIAGITLKFWTGRENEVWQWLLAGLLAYLATLVMFVISLKNAPDYPWVNFGLAVINVRQLGTFSAMGFSIAIMLALFAREARQRWAYCAAASLMIALTFWSGTRSALIGVLVALFIAVVLTKECRKLILLQLTVTSLLVGALLGSFNLPPAHEFGTLRIFFDSARDGMDQMSSGRMTVWISTLETIQSKPIFGFGEAQFRHTVPAAQDLLNHPHNVFIQFVFIWGIVGALCIFALGGMLLCRLVRATRADPESHLPAFLASASLFVIALIDGALYYPYTVMCFVFFTTVAISAAPSSKRDVQTKPTARSPHT